eukprot:TRINITY_DN4459_c0_g1_i1.p1 TRINITY_DN4459_c0_g1~~TRINITY_DN4459_c0_g1_i1.p1  ORF type:complete len:227 (+),score=20.02 TRINITY_DN4459_c0_g1_i1:40-720(+)
MAATLTWSCKVLLLGERSTSGVVPGSLTSPVNLQWHGPLRWTLQQVRYRGFNRTSTPICMVLPTGQQERASRLAHPLWSARAIKSFSMAELEARKLKYPTTGTEALLMGILTEGTSHAAKFLRANGVSLFGVRDEVIKLLGKADMYYFSPEHPPLTEPAQKALDWALEEKEKIGEDGEVTTSHLLLGIWAQKESAGYQVLASLEITDNLMEQFALSERTSRNKVLG